MSDKMKNLIVRSITGVIFVAAVVTCFLRPEAMILLFALITGLTVWEYTGIVNNIENVTVNRFLATVAGVYLFFGVAGFCSGIVPSAVFIPYLLTVVYMFISELYTKAPNPINNWAYTMLSQMYIALPLSMLNVLAFRGTADGVVYTSLLPLSVFIFLWTNDTGAYLSGSLFGKHKLFPRVSPGKSWEGSIGGGILVIVVAALIGMYENSDMHTGTVDWYGARSRVLRNMGRPRGVAVQAHHRHQGLGQHSARTRWHARPLRLVADGYSGSRDLSVYTYADVILRLRRGRNSLLYRVLTSCH